MSKTTLVKEFCCKHGWQWLCVLLSPLLISLWLYTSLLVIKTKLIFTSTQAGRGKTDRAKDFRCQLWYGEICYTKCKTYMQANIMHCSAHCFQDWLMTFPYIVRSKTLLLKIELKLSLFRSKHHFGNTTSPKYISSFGQNINRVLC